MSSHFGLVQPLLTDYYQLTMSYGYWKAGKANEQAVFEIFFRRNPFHGEFTIFAGLADCVDYLKSFRFTADDIDYLKQAMPAYVDQAFFDYLLQLGPSDFSLWSVDEGSTVFPKEPIMRIEGSVVICQLLETTLLNLVSFASLIATNAARFRLAAGPDKQLYEFGLRRAQGPDGALSASRYSYLGGYDGTSNVLAGKLFGIPVIGTHAHSFISVYQGNSDLNHAHTSNLPATRTVATSDRLEDFHDRTMTLSHFLERCWHWSSRLSVLLNYAPDQVHPGELTAFANYAYAFPIHFVGLVDTYDVLRSGLPNFCAVSLALHEYGHRSYGLRIDSGDLAFLSFMVRSAFEKVANHYDLPYFKDLHILVSNDLNEETLYSLKQQHRQLPSRLITSISDFQVFLPALFQLPPCHSIDAFCVGTHLVTCQKQPALGCVYKLVEISGIPTMKLSASVDKVSLPGRKTVYRLYGKTNGALLDLVQRTCEPVPKANERILCRHPSEASKRVFVIPARVEEILKPVWIAGQLVNPLPTLEESRSRVKQEMDSLRPDYKRILNPTPYKVSLSEELYNFTSDLWFRMTPIAELA